MIFRTSSFLRSPSSLTVASSASMPPGFRKTRTSEHAPVLGVNDGALALALGQPHGIQRLTDELAAGAILPADLAAGGDGAPENAEPAQPHQRRRQAHAEAKRVDRGVADGAAHRRTLGNRQRRH